MLALNLSGFVVTLEVDFSDFLERQQITNELPVHRHTEIVPWTLHSRCLLIGKSRALPTGHAKLCH